ncbi:MAG: response regulator, partial [Verrucomicrobiales bacterium]
ILLVDDNTTNLQVLFQALSPEGYELLVAQSGEDALETAGSAKPDLLLLDVKMPGIDGFETFRRLRADSETSAIPVIFLSAHANVESIEQAEALGAEGYLTKPFDFDVIIQKVREVLGAD